MANRWSSLAAVAFAVAIVVGVSLPARGAEDEESDASGAAEAPEEKGPNTGRFSLTFQNDFTNAYIFRGIMNERDGFIWQPWIEGSLNLWKADDGPVRGVSLGMGVWNSIHSKKTLAEHSPTSLYETDWYPMLSVDFAENVNLTTYYYFYTSPNGAFDTVQELDFKIAWDDSDVLGVWAMQPWVNFAVETDRTSLGDQEGSGVELGIEPTLYELDDETFPLSLTVPVELGLSIDNYYEEPGRRNDTFGYLSWGLTASLPITCIPKDFGKWTFGLTGKGYYFSNTLARVNFGDRLYPLVMASLTFEY